MMKTTTLLLVICLQSLQALAEEAIEMTDEELAEYQFPNAPVEVPATVRELNVGQRHIMNIMRRDFQNLIARRLGIMSLDRNESDLRILQSVVDRELIDDDEVREWQTMGVVLGDILATEQGLSWVSYEDDVGVSKALRWRQTDNFVFPVTVFSKRVRFGEELDIRQIYDKLTLDIVRFKKLPVSESKLR